MGGRRWPVAVDDGPSRVRSAYPLAPCAVPPHSADRPPSYMQPQMHRKASTGKSSSTWSEKGNWPDGLGAARSPSGQVPRQGALTTW